MAYVVGVPLLAVLAALQSVVLSHVLLIQGRPDLVLVAVVAWGLAGRSTEALIWGLVGGLFLDELSGLPMGTTGAVLVVVAYLVTSLERRFWEAHFLVPLGVMLVASLVFHTLGLAAVLVSGREINLPMAISRVILPSTFLNVILAYPALQLAESLKAALFPPEVRV